ncbi:MAG: ATP-binding protein, partial [Cetobacterium sp.]
MKKCEKCGKEYKEIELNEVFKNLSQETKDKLRFVPTCECLIKEMEEKSLELDRQQEKERRENRIKKYKNISVVDKKFIESNFEKADLKDKHMILAKKYAEKFILKGTLEKGIIFFGNPGTGKTFASACISNYLMENNKTVLALSLGAYLSKLKQEWEQAERDVLKHVGECDLLVLDDFGSEHKSDWAISKIFSLIDTRYRSGKPMIITTNLDYNEDKPCEITQKFSIDGKDRIKDRIKDMCFPMKCVGES